MIYPLLFALLGLQFDASERQQNERGNQELPQVVQSQPQSAEGHQSSTFRDDSSGQNLKVPCAADVRWHSPFLPARPWAITSVVRLELRSSVGVSAVCLPASIQLRVNYYEGEDTFVCGGDTVLTQNRETQNRTFELRPLNTELFFTWQDGPDDRETKRRLVCYDQRAAEVRDPARRSTHLKVFATLIPKAGGYAISEATIPLKTADPVPVPSVLPEVRGQR